MKICFITSGRADYGLLRPLILKLKKSADHQVQVVATGTHFSSMFGNTVSEIFADNIRIDYEIPLDLESEENALRMQEMAKLATGLEEAYATLKPDLVVILGDRYETLSAAVATVLCEIPIAHIHGGEETIGSADNLYRHAITKLSTIHLVSTEAYRNRVLQMGEDPSCVHNVGALGVDNVKSLDLMSKLDLSKDIGFDFDDRNLLVTFHPATLERDKSEDQFNNLLCALDFFHDRSIVITFPNSDKGGNALIGMIERFAVSRPNVLAIKSLGRLRYLSLVKYSSVVVGNSSSGIIEVPSLFVPTVTIGDRQDGRVMPESVICCPPFRDDIIASIQLAETPAFRELVRQTVNPYDSGSASGNICSVFDRISQSDLMQKPFVDF